MGSGLRGQGDEVIIILPSLLLLLHVLPLPALGDLRGFEDVSLPVLLLIVVAAELCTEHGVEAGDGVAGVPPLQESPGRSRSEEVRRREGGRRRSSHALQCLDNFITPVI